MVLKIIEFLKKYWLFVLLGALVILVISLKIFASSPKPSPTPTPSITPSPSAPSLSPLIINGKAIPSRAKFSAQTSFLPQNATVYQGEKSTLSEQEASNIAQKLGFAGPSNQEQDTVFGSFYAWSSSEYYLSVWTQSPKIDYELASPRTALTKEGIFPDQNQAQSILNDLLNKADVKPPSGLVFLKIRYFKVVDNNFIESTSQNADFMQAGFAPSLNNYHLLTNNLFEPPVYLRLTRSSKIIRFVYTATFSNFIGVNSFPLKNQAQITSSLVTEGKIIDQDYSTDAAGNLDFTNAEFNQISLAYFQQPTVNNLLQPIYVLSGTGTLSNGQQTRITAFLPAINYEGAPLSPAPTSRFKF